MTNLRLLYNRLLSCTIILIAISFGNSTAQSQNTYMRIARITVDSTQLSNYLMALKTQMEAALKHEKKGVLAYSAVQDKHHPHRITILETYASVAAYQSHIQTDHFKRYKTTVADMVKELELTDVIPITIQSKQK